MEIFKKRGAMTHFQILSEISKQEPHLKQKDLAERLGITIQAVSENIKTLIEEGYITSKDGRSPYKITQDGIAKVKRDAITLRKYSDGVLETMNYYKSVWPAIANENLKEGEIVGLFMNNGLLYATNESNKSATAEVLTSTKKGFDVALTNLKGTIDLKEGQALIISIPTIKEGGSKETKMDFVKDIYESKYSEWGINQIDKVGTIGTISHVVANNLDIPIDIEFATAASAVSVIKKGLNVLIIVVGNMTKNISKSLEDANIKYNIIDAKK